MTDRRRSLLSRTESKLKKHAHRQTPKALRWRMRGCLPERRMDVSSDGRAGAAGATDTVELVSLKIALTIGVELFAVQEMVRQRVDSND